MKITVHHCLKYVAIFLTFVVVAGSFSLGYLWKSGRNRGKCKLNLFLMEQAIQSYAGPKNISPLTPFPGGPRELLRDAGYASLPVCPSGGTYTFWSETTYSPDPINVRCSHADDLGHRRDRLKEPKSVKNVAEQSAPSNGDKPSN